MGFRSWFRRRPASAGSPLVFATAAAADAFQRRLDDAGLTLIGQRVNGGNTYVTLRGDDPEAAKAFLRKEPVTRDFYYVVVETPDGVWGTDVNTLYLEKLRPWQRDAGAAECDATIEALIDGHHNLITAAQGIMDNFLVEVSCGRCAQHWIDGVRYRAPTLVRCPACGTANRVDSSAITVDGF
jgi:hypothetical protein